MQWTLAPITVLELFELSQEGENRTSCTIEHANDLKM